MAKENEIKAIFSLLESEPSRKEQLMKSLAALYMQNPRQVFELAKKYYVVFPPYIKVLFQTAQNNNLKKEIKRFFNLANPDLLESLILLAKIINPQQEKEPLLNFFNLAKKEFDKNIDSSFDISQKAQVLKTFFFEINNFEVESLSRQKELLNLPEIFKNKKTTPLIMAVIYLIFITPYEVKADIFEVENKIIVRLRDSFSLEPVYIDVYNKGRFVSEDECDMYAAGNFIKWNSKNIVPLTSRDIFKRLLAGLIDISKKTISDF